MSNFKDSVSAHCIALLQQKVAGFKAEKEALQLSANSETKNSAGDKYETGRAMAQLEADKLTSRIAHTERELQTVQTLAAKAGGNQSGKVVPGALVYCREKVFYISVPLGLMEVEGKAVTAVSGLSPLGAAFLGKTAGQQINLNQTTYLITEVD